MAAAVVFSLPRVFALRRFIFVGLFGIKENLNAKGQYNVIPDNNAQREVPKGKKGTLQALARFQCAPAQLLGRADGRPGPKISRLPERERLAVRAQARDNRSSHLGSCDFLLHLQKAQGRRRCFAISRRALCRRSAKSSSDHVLGSDPSASVCCCDWSTSRDEASFRSSK